MSRSTRRCAFLSVRFTSELCRLAQCLANIDKVAKQSTICDFAPAMLNNTAMEQLLSNFLYHVVFVQSTRPSHSAHALNFALVCCTVAAESVAPSADAAALTQRVEVLAFQERLNSGQGLILAPMTRLLFIGQLVDFAATRNSMHLFALVARRRWELEATHRIGEICVKLALTPTDPFLAPYAPMCARFKRQMFVLGSEFPPPNARLGAAPAAATVSEERALERNAESVLEDLSQLRSELSASNRELSALSGVDLSTFSWFVSAAPPGSYVHGFEDLDLRKSVDGGYYTIQSFLVRSFLRPVIFLLVVNCGAGLTLSLSFAVEFVPAWLPVPQWSACGVPARSPMPELQHSALIR